MDFHRANRNLQLVESGISDDKNSANLSLDETQVPVLSGFSSDSDKDEQEQIFINTQVQGRLDEAEEADKVRASLGEFRYNIQDNNTSPKRKSTLQRPSARITKRSNPSQRNKQSTKAQSLLKQLSGKHAKVHDMIKYQQKLDSIGGSQQRTKNKGRTTKAKKEREKKYDTYNANEWQHIYNLLLEKFPHTRPSEVEDVYQYLYGNEDEDQPLWNESQRPIESESQDLGSLPPPADNQRVSVLSLSQVMDDNPPMEPDEDVIVPDSTDEECIVIPIPTSPQPPRLLRPPLIAKPPLLTKPTLRKPGPDADTPKTAYSPSDGVIDLTEGSFKAVKSLISPLKEETAQVQVPATRMPTLGTTPNLVPTRDQPLRYRLHRSQLESFSAVEGLIVHSPGQSQDDVPVPDTELEDSDAEGHYMVELEPSKLTTRTPSPSVQFDWNSQSAQQLRQSMKSLGLKTSRSKHQMLHSLQQASQVLEIDNSGQENQRQDIHNYLTSLVQSSPALLEKVYTFQPIASKELLTRLTETNPFVDIIDEYTIREWADNQGICLTTS
ncbi:hypothetical protein ZYGR_0AS04520 [Zygosaccharomyces rouxii]|uniref:Structure-specific endonuclease subunit SLX4 n=1 Tax=Zygosaccharomyces rouxii TaxID=4956 RepID=A0A1Q3AHA5_ZYGRO|nr:hypothetical protein ZYGR_0AS04520 [Zygosaccharomyces rouxii]